ncbi:MAG: hypothetical protein NC489_22485, partial [Ruminococcus flavefaciens]|nr:hypothetical protein [Ruminococcus flavefaciens]
MKKTWKLCGAVIGLGGMFLAGYLCFGKISILEKKREIQMLVEYNHARNSNENVYGKELTQEDAEFLVEHILGQWKVVERIRPVNGANISAQGVE